MQRRKILYRPLLLAVSLACMGWWLAVTSATSAEQTTESSQGQSPSNQVVVTAGDLRMIIEKTPQGMHARNLTDTATGQELLADDPPPLFSAVFREAKTKEQLTVAADSGWRQVDISETVDPGGYRLTFTMPIDDFS